MGPSSVSDRPTRPATSTSIGWYKCQGRVGKFVNDDVLNFLCRKAVELQHFAQRFDAMFNTPDIDVADEILAPNFRTDQPLGLEFNDLGQA